MYESLVMYRNIPERKEESQFCQRRPQQVKTDVVLQSVLRGVKSSSWGALIVSVHLVMRREPMRAKYVHHTAYIRRRLTENTTPQTKDPS